MILFATAGYETLAEGMGAPLGSEAGRFVLDRFPNGELRLSVRSAVRGRHCAVLGTIAPPDERLAGFLLLCHTLSRLGAERVTAVLPYLAYARQDREEPGATPAMAWVGDLLEASGVDEAVTVDVHSARAQELCAVPLLSVSPAPLFAEFLAPRGLLEATLVAPDEGAVARCDDLAHTAGWRGGRTRFEKRRRGPEVVSSEMASPAGPRAVVADDILDTGQTLLACCRALRAQGTEEITVLVTHGLFTGALWKELRALGVARLVTTDTVPAARGRAGDGWIEVVPAGPLLASGMRELEVTEGA